MTGDLNTLNKQIQENVILFLLLSAFGKMAEGYFGDEFLCLLEQ